MRIMTTGAALLLSGLLAGPALAGQSGGTMDSGSTGMGTGSSRLNRNAAPNLRMGGGTTGMYHGTSGSNMPRYAGSSPATSPSVAGTTGRDQHGHQRH